MRQKDQNRGRRRVLLVAARFVAGAVVGVGVLTHMPGSTSGSDSTATDRRSGQGGGVGRSIALSQFDAETIPRTC